MNETVQPTGVLRVGVLGPGGVGGLIAALLARTGADVVCIASPPTAQAIASSGLSVTSERFGSFHVNAAAATELRTPVDVLCITVKATSLESSLERIPPEVISGAVIVPFLNGIEHVDFLRRHFEEDAVVAATIRIESTRMSPSLIVQKSPFALIELAPRPTARRQVAAFAELLSSSGFDVHVREDERAILWEKLAFLAPLALLTTAYDASAGEVRSQHRDEFEAMLSELARVAQLEGITIDTVGTLAQLDTVPETMRSSMQRDAEAGRPLEIDAIGGAIVRLADRSALAVPTFSSVISAIRAHKLHD